MTSGKTFVISIPKAGTYLMRELLDQIGLDSSHLHVSYQGTYDYSKVSIDEGRRRPRSCFTPMTIEQSINDIPENSFAVGHLPYSASLEKILDGFTIIFIGRDVKETVLSAMIFLLESGRAHLRPKEKPWVEIRNKKKQLSKFIDVNGVRILKQYNAILEWKKYDHVNCFDFNAILASPFKQIKRLAGHNFAHAGILADHHVKTGSTHNP